MMKQLLIVASLAACGASAASAAPSREAGHGPRACAPRGTPIFEVQASITSGPHPATTSRLYADGAYTSDGTDASGASNRHVANVCVSEAQLADAKAAIAAASWTITTARIKCMVRSFSQTVYLVDGKPVYTEAICSGRTLDKDSAAALTTLKAILAGPAT